MKNKHNSIKETIAEFRAEVPVWQYILWWAARIWLVIVIITDYKEHIGDGHYNLQMISNLGMTFLLPLVKLLARGKNFFGRITLRTNGTVVFMVFATCVLGLHYNFYGNLYWYDTLLHFAAGILLVAVGTYIMRAFGETDMSPLISSVCGFGLSCFGSLFWEFYEFMFDNLTGAVTQAWWDGPTEFFASLIPDMDPRRYGLLDTMCDLSAGLFGALVAAVAVRIVAERRKKERLGTPVPVSTDGHDANGAAVTKNVS